MDIRSNLNNKQGLYDPANEHDACGVGLVVNVHGGKSHGIVESALKILENMGTEVRKERITRPATVQASCCKFHTSLSYCKASPYRKKVSTEPD